MSQEQQQRRPVEAGGIGPMGRSGMSSLGKPVQKARNFKATLKRLASYFLPHKYLLLLVLGTSILGTLFTAIAPKILGLVTTRLFAGALANYQALQHHQPAIGLDLTSIGKILLLLLGLYLLSAIFLFAQQYIMAGIAQKTVYRLRKEVDAKLSHLPLPFFDSHPRGEILSRAVNDMDNLSTTLQQSVTQLINSTVTILSVLIMMVITSWQLCLIVLGTLPLSMMISMSIARRSQSYFRQQQRALGKLNGHVEEMYTGYKAVKAFGREAWAIATFAQLNEQLYEAGWRAQFVSGIIMPLMMFIGNLAYVAIASVGSILVTSGTIAIGDVQAFIQYAQQFTQPIAMLANIVNVIQSSAASAERVFELLDEPEELPDSANALLSLAPLNARPVQIQHIRFGYQTDIPLIDDLTVDVQAGQKIAIVGPTGAGKTTLVNLLMRFYEIEVGRILVNGADIAQLKRSDLRRTFGMVLQDTWLFSDTIYQNIAYGREDATEAEIIQAAQAAQADHFIRTLPEGYRTLLNQEASNISQGQKQLLTIARAFLADPEILILDEATSNVDPRTELLIQKAMSQLMQGRTSFVIAHRLSTIRDANLILVMNHGTIVERGTHQELLGLKGFYANLYESQFRRQLVSGRTSESLSAGNIHLSGNTHL